MARRMSATLQRTVSRWEIVALALNDVIGSGIYLLPATATALLGAASFGAIALAGLAVFLLILCFAEAASYFDEPGGAYVYTRAAFGELVGFEVGWMTWLARLFSLASIAVGTALALGRVWAPAQGGLGRALAIVLPVVGLAAINVYGVKSGARTAVVFAVGKIVPLVFFVLVGVGGIEWARVIPTAWPPRDRLGEAALLILFAYSGFENTAAPAGEFENPRRDVPFALVTAMALITAIYSLVQLVALGVLPALGAARTPLADAAELRAGPVGGWLLTVGAAMSTIGTNSNTTLSGPRYLYALANRGFGPRALARLHPRFATPANAIAAQTVLALGLALALHDFALLAALSVLARLSSYVGTAAALPVLRARFPDVRARRTPAGLLVPTLALLLCGGLLASAKRVNLAVAAAALLVGLVLFALRRRDPSDSGGGQRTRANGTSTRSSSRRGALVIR
jgi:amino acid transporter